MLGCEGHDIDIRAVTAIEDIGAARAGDDVIAAKAIDHINARRPSQAIGIGRPGHGIGLSGEVIAGGTSIAIARRVLDRPGRKCDKILYAGAQIIGWVNGQGCARQGQTRAQCCIKGLDDCASGRTRPDLNRAGASGNGLRKGQDDIGANRYARQAVCG